MRTQRRRRWILVLSLGGLALLAACGGKGKAATSGGSPNFSCSVQERLTRTVPGLVEALMETGWEVVPVEASEAPPQQTRQLAEQVVARQTIRRAVLAQQLSVPATAGNPGTQSGGTNQAGGDTTNNFFCGKDSGPVAFPGSTVNVNSGNTTTENPPVAERVRR